MFDCACTDQKQYDWTMASWNSGQLSPRHGQYNLCNINVFNMILNLFNIT